MLLARHRGLRRPVRAEGGVDALVLTQKAVEARLRPAGKLRISAQPFEQTQPVRAALATAQASTASRRAARSPRLER